MLVLGIESSCDETAVALVDDGRLVLERLATQEAVHAVFGGVVPELASREHLRLLPHLGREVFAATGVRPEDLDGIAVARGPGLLGSLLVGLGYAKGLALAAGVPLVGVNHCQAHLLAAGLEAELPLPAVGLLVSGGHTQLYRIGADLRFELLGLTRDDAAGEAFDKVAKLVNLPYPGGRHVDELSRQGRADPKRFARPLLEPGSLDFSFSGLKTAVAQAVAEHPGFVLGHMALPEQGAPPRAEDMLADMPAGQRQALCDLLASFSLAVVETLVIKTRRAVERVRQQAAGEMPRGLIAAGGVAANSLLRAKLAELAQDMGLQLLLPRPALCTDNAAMIAHAGWRLLRRGLRHDQRLEAVPRGRVVPEDFVVSAGECR